VGVVETCSSSIIDGVCVCVAQPATHTHTVNTTTTTTTTMGVVDACSSCIGSSSSSIDGVCVVLRPCVGVVKEPPEEEQWFCRRCQLTPLTANTPAAAAARTKRRGGAGARGRGRRPAKRR